MSKADFKKNFFKIYLGYLDDLEPELRAIASSKLDVVGATIEKEDIVKDLVPLIKKLSADS